MSARITQSGIPAGYTITTQRAQQNPQHQNLKNLLTKLIQTANEKANPTTGQATAIHESETDLGRLTITRTVEIRDGESRIRIQITNSQDHTLFTIKENETANYIVKQPIPKRVGCCKYTSHKKITVITPEELSKAATNKTTPTSTSNERKENKPPIRNVIVTAESDFGTVKHQRKRHPAKDAQAQTEPTGILKKTTTTPPKQRRSTRFSESVLKRDDAKLTAEAS